jgi:Glycosyl hydrolase family 99
MLGKGSRWSGCPVAVVAIVVLCLVIIVWRPTTATSEPAQRPLIVVHYMPWFEARPVSARWGWHWTMNTFDPEQVTDGKRSIAAHYYPLIGPYDSGDPAVIEYHLLLMKLAGIDGLIADWYGLSHFLDYPTVHRNTSALFPPAAKMGLRIGICYEDQTIPRLVQATQLLESERVDHARREIEWLGKNWFVDPTYLKLNGKPLLLSFGEDGLTDREWERVFAGKPATALYLSEHRRRTAAAGGFDWPVPKEGLSSLDRFYKLAHDWPVAMPVAFPRFHDIYEEAHVHASWGAIADDAGRTFTATLGRALKSGAPLVQIATWNDWGEGTAVEPSVEFGCRDLEAVQRLRREGGDAAFSFTPRDLRLPHRLFVLRRRYEGQPPFKAKLDEVAGLLAAGAVSKARQALDRIEAAAR